MMNSEGKWKTKYFSIFIKKVLNRILTIFRIGDTIKIYAEKKINLIIIKHVWDNWIYFLKIE